MIYDKWRGPRPQQFQEVNNEPSMVEPCFNPTIKDYLSNPALIARQGMFDDGEDIEELPDLWNDEPLYNDLPLRKVSKAAKQLKKEPNEPSKPDNENERSEDEDKGEGGEDGS
nr:MAG: hypothetical protein [Microvirus sp.]